MRAGEGPLNPVGDEPTSTLSRLVAGGPGRVIEAHAFDVAPGETLGSWFEHDGEDLLMVLEGAAAGGVRRRAALRARRQATCCGTCRRIAHRWSVVGPAPARLLLVNARPAASPTAHGG